LPIEEPSDLETRTAQTSLLLPGAGFRIRLDIEGAGSQSPAHLTFKLLQTEDLEMRANFDFAPYRRSTVGFDRFFDLLETGMRSEAADGYPPFDILRDGEDSYRITLAIAGFRPDEIEIVAQQNLLVVTGKRAQEEAQGDYLYRGIAARAFERRFQLADFIEAGEATFDHGLLTIALKRVVPEAMKPRRIEIGGAKHANDQLEGPQVEARSAA
jgi:molecular chaperone IbpA